MANKFELPDGYDLVGKYLAGMSLKQLGGELHVARQVLRKLLVQAGVDIRGIAEQGRIVWRHIKSQGAQAVHAQVKWAHRARRGQREPRLRQGRRADTRETRRSHTGRFEQAVALALRTHGLRVEEQAACGPYNLDIFLPERRIVVEIVGSTNKPEGSRFGKRTKNLLDAGLWILFVYFDRRYPARASVDAAAVADKALSLCKCFRGDPSERGQYWVIWGNGEPKTGPGYDFNRRALMLHSEG